MDSSRNIVVSIGDLVTDLVVNVPHLPVEAGKHQLAHAITVEPGGAGNFLIAGERLGLQMVALGAIGRDIFGEATVAILEQEGIDLEGLYREAGTTTTTVIVLADGAGGHVFVGKYGGGPTVPFSDVWKQKIDQAQAVFGYGYTIQEERLAQACLEGMAYARSLGIPVFFDPGPEMVRTTPAQRQAVLQNSDVILLTEEEIPLMSGGPEGVPAARALLQAGVQQVCIKRGGRGCLILTDSAEIEHPGYPVRVVDTTAAGDSFAAAYIFASLKGRTLEETAAFANAVGAAKVMKIGSGSQVPTLAEVRGVLEEYEVGIWI